MKLIQYIILLILLTPWCITAQENNSDLEIKIPASTVHVLGERTSEAIHLRWVPSDARLWHICNKTGYTVSRMKIDEASKSLNGTFTEVAKISPTSKEAWEAYLIANDLPDYPSVAMECIYGEFGSLSLGESLNTIFAKADELSNKYSFALFAADMDQKTAEMSGLLYKDMDIEKDAVYVYKVTPIVPTNMSINYSNGAVLMDKQITSYPPIMLQGQIADGSIELRWNRETYESIYTAYTIERSTDDKNFVALNARPYVHGVSSDSMLISPYMSFIDPVENYQIYYYRVIGLTAFGSKGIVAPSMTLMAKDLTPPAIPTQLKATHVHDATVKLEWDYDATENIMGFNIYRGHTYEDNYYPLNNKLIPADQRSYEDKVALLNDRNYYYVAAIDTAGNKASSHIAFGSITDTIPPPPPSGLTAKADTNGIVTLEWNPSLAPDILGYKIFYANADYHEFSLLTGQAITNNIYLDSISLNTLTKHAYYRVMAVDQRYNYSPLSEIIEVERPDIIPPTSPIFTDYNVNDGHIYLAWAPSHSVDLDLHQLWKKEKDKPWEKISDIMQNINEYKDTDIVSGAAYQYKIVAIDKSGLSSKVAFVIYLEALEKILEESLQNITLMLNDKNQPKISWQAPGNKNHDVVIYRSSSGSGFQVLKIIEKNNTSFVDRNTRIGNTYKYTLKARYNDGAQSKFSDVQEISIQ